MIKKFIAVLGLLVGSIIGSSTIPANASFTITKLYDGDTITLSTGERVRLLQIDSPELSPAECYGDEARSALVGLLSGPGQLILKTDPKLDKVDRYGRLLRYVYKGKTNINLKLVEIGAAAPYFYKGEKGKFASQISKAAQRAKAKSLGLWKSCPGTKLAPNVALTTVSAVMTGGASASNNSTCDPNYKECLPVFPPDLDCTDVKRLGLAPVHVIGTDVHKLDRDGDGVGCNS